MAKNKALTLEDTEEALNNLIVEQGITIRSSTIELVGDLTNGEALYRANLGTKEHPFWVFGDKESVQKRIGLFQRQMLDMLKGNNK